MKKDEHDIPKSRKSYLFKMAAKMAVKQGKRYLNNNPESRLQVLVDQADILVNHVGRLKGAAMKAIQTITVEGHDLLPPEVMVILEKLQSQAPPMPKDLLIDQIKKELGEERFALLENISDEPIAAASIGQVYAATYQGKPVVIKIQYPGIAESVDADIDTLKKILKTILVVSRKKVELDELIEEARRVLKLETDYHHEEKSLLLYKSLFEGSEYVIPGVYTEFTTKKVLVLTREEGLELTTWLGQNPSEEKRQRVAKQLLQLYIKEFFENHLVQTDPNPANFLVNSQDQLVLLDFGATMDFSPQFVSDYQKLLRAVFSQRRDEILKSVFELKFLSPKESKETQDAFIDFLMFSLTPFEPERQPFDFSDDAYTYQVRQEALRFSRLLKFSAPPKQLIFLHRKLGGIFMILKKLQVEADLTSFRELVLSKNF